MKHARCFFGVASLTFAGIDALYGILRWDVDLHIASHGINLCSTPSLVKGYDLSDSAGALLVLLCLLQAKHMFADYFLQTKIMLDGRETYVHFGRFLHAGIHAVGSVIVFAVIGTSFAFIIPIVLAELIVHYHIDWLKGRYTTVQKLTPADAAFWRAAGVDQAMHQLTYVVMIWLWVLYTPS